MIGTQIGNRYQILSEVGRGSLGTVYKAQDLETQKLVAIKVLEQLPQDEVPYKRFLRSIEATKVLSHPNVLAPIDSGFVNETQPYVVTELCTGTLLSDILKKDKHLEVERAVRIAAQVCDAIDHAHYYGVIHRNLTPFNIMIEGTGAAEQAKVLDFGLAKSFFQISKKGNYKLTLTGEVIGTPEFMSPEQCKQKEIDWRSDIYSMGCLIYAMLTGRPPIRGNTQMDTVMRQESDTPMPFERACENAKVPEAVQQVVFKALNKKPEERQQTMVELRDELFIASGLLPQAGSSAGARKNTGEHARPQAPQDGMRG